MTHGVWKLSSVIWRIADEGFGCKIMKVVVSQEEWQRRVIILNEIVVVVFHDCFSSSTTIEKQVEALNKGDYGL